MTGKRSDPGMSTIVRTVARWLRGIVLLYGIYIVLYGHLTPGGGFAGGVVIACAFALMVLALGGDEARRFFHSGLASRLDSVGILAFLVIALVGTWLAGGYFFENFIATSEEARFALFSAGTIPMSNMALGLKVASSIFLVFAVLAAFRVMLGDGGETEGGP